VRRHGKTEATSCARLAVASKQRQQAGKGRSMGEEEIEPPSKSSLPQSEALLESLERTLSEIDALRAIFGTDDDDDGTVDDRGNDDRGSFVVRTSSSSSLGPLNESLDACRTAVDSNDSTFVIPTFRVELKVDCGRNYDDGACARSLQRQATLQCSLPPGYPEFESATNVYVRCGSKPSSGGGQKLSWCFLAELTSKLESKARELVGGEAVMELAQYLQELMIDAKEDARPSDVTPDHREERHQQRQKRSDTVRFGRRWIWVHHITSSDRVKSISKRAREGKLAGYLKTGYPGVVVVEGPSEDADEFVRWIKGNKSRPDGGFGRNWGHHVRGEVDCLEDDEDFRKLLDEEFEEVGESMKVLAAKCGERGLTDEFREFVLQHKKSGGDDDDDQVEP